VLHPVLHPSLIDRPDLLNQQKISIQSSQPLCGLRKARELRTLPIGLLRRQHDFCVPQESPAL